MNVNSVVMSGNLTKDAELKRTANGTPVLSFSLAVNRSVKRGDEWEKVASFFDWELFGAGAEGIAQYMEKGRHITVQGRAQQNRWEKDGEPRSRVVFVASEIDLGPRQTPDGVIGRQQPEMPAGAAYQRARAASAEHEPVSVSVYDEDVPF